MSTVLSSLMALATALLAQEAVTPPVPAEAAVNVPVDEVISAPADQDALEPLEPMELQAGPIKAQAVSFPTLSDEEVFAKAMDAIEAIDTMTASFVQVSPSGTITTGQLSLDRPGRLRFDYDQPSDQLIVATGGVVYVHDAALETTDSYPVGKTPLRFLLTKRIDREGAELRDIYRTSDGVALMLASTDEEVSGELALVFSAPDMQLQEWVIVEPNGAATRVTLNEVVMGQKISSKLFRVPDSGGTFLRDR